MPTTSPDHIQALFAAQRARAPHLALLSAAERAARIRRVVTYLQERQTEFVEALQADLRRAPLDTLAELLIAKNEGSFAIQHLAAWLKPHRVKNALMSQGTTSYTLYEPKGVALILSTWNAPFAISLVPLIGALAAGNAAILKPSELAPHSAELLQRMLESLFPPDEVAVVQGDAATAGQLLALPFDHIYFTGSPAVGKLVMAAAAQHLTSVTLELGGKSPTIVDQSADLTPTAYKIGWGKCANSGQACVAPDYVLVHERVQADLIAALQNAISAMYNPDGRGWQTSPALCRIVNQRHFRRIQGLVEDAVARGATIAYGGEMDEADLYIAPTLLTGVTDEMAIMHEEIFGPVLPIISYPDNEAALGFIRQRGKPLALYIFSRDQAVIDLFLRRTSAGSTVVNHNMIQAGVNPHLPFGGVNQSGAGRSVGKATFESFSNLRSVVEQPRGWRDFYWLSLPPYSTTYQRMLRWLFAR